MDDDLWNQGVLCWEPGFKGKYEASIFHEMHIRPAYPWDPPINPHETPERRAQRIDAFSEWARRGFVVGCA
jgi:hypothetical protein